MTGIPTGTGEQNKPGNKASEDELRLVAALRAGDEASFVSLVTAYHTSLVRLAAIYVHDGALAEEVAQETWLAVLKGLEQFEGRSSLKTWIWHILLNRARTRGKREGRTVTFSSIRDSEAGGDSTIDPDLFLPPDHPRWPGHWKRFPASWSEIPEDRILSVETSGVIKSAIDALPRNQREVIVMCDVQGWATAEVCNILGITETNQRVLLHRARSRVRRALEAYWRED